MILIWNNHPCSRVGYHKLIHNLSFTIKKYEVSVSFCRKLTFFSKNEG
jgi:hypothetical protein